MVVSDDYDDDEDDEDDDSKEEDDDNDDGDNANEEDDDQCELWSMTRRQCRASRATVTPGPRVPLFSSTLFVFLSKWV